ncbi:MAG: hypothetical protein IT510_14360 [Sulfuritalea sp.]|nr:hypothetical protein [Sulfuritalea sp.]
MKLPKHQEQSRTFLGRLAGWGFPPGVQQRMGAFAIVWGIFESALERTLWVLCDESVSGIRPSTDKTSVNEWIKTLGEPATKFEQDVYDLLRLTSLAANDLIEYRHALVHGWLIPFQTGPTFIRNPRWNGELRKRPTGDAHVSENLLDMAIDTAWVLCRVLHATQDACIDSSKVRHLLALKSEIVRAKTQASELRHLTDSMSHEKN